MKAYMVKGRFEMGWIGKQNFEMEVAAASPEKAAETVYTDIGSKHKAKRRQIKIESVKEMRGEDLENPIIRHKVGVKDEKR